ncbi:PP2C family protein-serine/threonine phosphatase [Amycolatopsis pigmentata]|uniref:PP2C family protein-serine/threonine phosphatase n=1 Tax=Amycolatopsis pigmentata TaxID=450801 RepID=A0ABW5FN83_9PSEU
MNDDRARDQRRSLVQAWSRAQLTIEGLWSRYFALGGQAGLMDVDAYLNGLGELPPLQRDVLAQAVNERLDELAGAHRAAYSRPIRQRLPASPPLAALVELLDRVVLAPPDRMAEIAAAAGKALGVAVTLFLIDYDQRTLHPVPHADGSTERVSLDVDTTLAGRAFRHVQTLPADTAQPPCLWVPLLDGVERLGVMAVEVTDPDDLYDPGLRAHCRWVAMLVGHLLIALNPHGDALDRVRLTRPRQPSAELVFSLLPSLTAGVDSFVVTGMLEPCERVSGDAFDYALSESTAHLIMLDALGHDLSSGLIAAAAVSAHRSARRAGNDLAEQAHRIDQTLREHFATATFATGVLVEIDLPTGRLRYVNAGHPQPLIMRDGKIVKPLAGALCLPLGLGPLDVMIAEETLEPDDWLILYTDGITEARDATGEFFGEERLVDFLRREAAAGYPPPETARRLIQAVLQHQQGVLQDDAAIVLARWTSPGHLDPER